MTQPPNPLPTPTRTPVGTNASSAAVATSTPARAPSVATAAWSPVLFATKAFRESEQPAKGVVIVANSDPTVSAVAAAAVAHGIVVDHAVANLPVRAISQISFLRPSRPRGTVPLNAFASSAVKAKLRDVTISHCPHLNPFVPEGVHIVLNHLKPGECVFVQVENKNLTDGAIVALAELNAQVEELGALLVIFVFHEKKQEMTWLREHCGVFVEVGKCEPGPGAQAAVALTNVSLSHWNPHGIGRVMVEAFLDANGVWTYRSEPFIADRAIIRLSWHLRFKGVTVEQIAKLIGIHKSNVSRGIDSLLIPPDNTVGLVPPKDSRKRWIGRYPDVEKLWPVNEPETSAGTGVVGEATNTSTPSKGGNTAHAANGAPVPGHARPVPPNGKP
jgi:hypothetical protein